MNQKPSASTNRAHDVARGLRKLAYFWLAFGLVAVGLATWLATDVPRVFAAETITEDDFTNGSDQAILAGVLQVYASRLDLAEATDIGATLTGGQTMTVVSPFTGDQWEQGQAIPVMITSPLINGVQPDNTQAAAHPYMNELRSRPDNMLVTRLPDEQQQILRAEFASVDGVTDTTIFVWPDHVTATQFGDTGPKFGFLQAFGILSVGLLFWIGSFIYGRRAKRL